MDPLRPFASLVQSLWKTQTDKSKTSAIPATANTGSSLNSGANAVAEPHAIESLELRLRRRLKQTGVDNPTIARDIFVETVLAWEIGEDITRISGFQEIARQVSRHIAANAQLDERLQLLLRSLDE